MTRVVGGVAGGRRLAVPAGSRTRPTAERVREALFATVQSVRGTLVGAVVLDLYAGSGALGLEALSRGAVTVTFVERDRAALTALRRNLASVGLPGGEVLAGPVARLFSSSPRRAALSTPSRPADLVLADPPYELGGRELAEALSRLAAAGWLAADALVVVERSARSAEPPWPDGWQALQSRRYGDTMLWYGRAPSGLLADAGTRDPDATPTGAKDGDPAAASGGIHGGTHSGADGERTAAGGKW